jgi:hypothetical protein
MRVMGHGRIAAGVHVFYLRPGRGGAAMTENLETRIDRLEKSARRWKLATLGVVALATAGVLMGQIRIGGAGAGGITAPTLSADKVTLKKMILTDGDGNERASAGVDGDGSAEWILKDKNGASAVVIRAAGDGGAAVKIYNGKGKPLAILATDAKDQPSLLLQDAEGKKVFGAP